MIRNTVGRHGDGAGPGSMDGRFVQWLTIADRKQAMIYDCGSGRLIEVPEADRAGAVTAAWG